MGGEVAKLMLSMVSNNLFMPVYPHSRLATYETCPLQYSFRLHLQMVSFVGIVRKVRSVPKWKLKLRRYRQRGKWLFRAA